MVRAVNANFRFSHTVGGIGKPQQILGRGRTGSGWALGSPPKKSREDGALRAWVEEKGQVYHGYEGKMGLDNRADDAKSHMRRPEKWLLDSISKRVSS